MQGTVGHAELHGDLDLHADQNEQPRGHLHLRQQDAAVVQPVEGQGLDGCSGAACRGRITAPPQPSEQGAHGHLHLHHLRPTEEIREQDSSKHHFTRS